METIGKIYAIVIQCRFGVLSAEKALEMIRALL